MKRPQNRHVGSVPEKKAPAKPVAPAKLKPQKVKASKPPKSQKLAKPTKDLKPARAAKTIASRGSDPKLQRESQRLRALRKVERSQASARRAEANRFTVTSRTRRNVLIATFVSFAALLGVVAASIFSPMLAVENIKIQGTDRLKVKSIYNAVVGQIGKPLPAINSSEIGKSLEAFALIESFNVVGLPPHTLLIQITERQPICVIASKGTNYLYDPAGVQIAKATGDNLAKYPTLDIAGEPGASPEFDAAIDVLLALPAKLLPRVASVQASTKDDVTLRLRGVAGQRVIWGDSSDAVLKSKVLAALIKNQRKSDVVTYDVSSPNAPVVRYGNF